MVKSWNVMIPVKMEVGVFQPKTELENSYLMRCYMAGECRFAVLAYYDKDNNCVPSKEWTDRAKDITKISTLQNVPVDGFRLAAPDNDASRYYNATDKFWIEDPRGFEFRVSSRNINYIMRNSECVNGQFSGNFVYGIDGDEILLIPITASDYKTFSNIEGTGTAKNHVTAKQLITGATYRMKNNATAIYMGVFPDYKHELSRIEPDTGADPDDLYSGPRYISREIENGKRYVFAEIRNTTPGKFLCTVKDWKNIGSNVIACLDSKKSGYFEKAEESMHRNLTVFPIDEQKDQVNAYPYSIFENVCKKAMSDLKPLEFYSARNEKSPRYRYKKYYCTYDAEKDMWLIDIMKKDYSKKRINIVDSIQEMYEEIYPAYITRYQVDGTLYDRSCYYGPTEL